MTQRSGQYRGTNWRPDRTEWIIGGALAHGLSLREVWSRHKTRPRCVGVVQHLPPIPRIQNAIGGRRGSETGGDDMGRWIPSPGFCVVLPPKLKHEPEPYPGFLPRGPHCEWGLEWGAVSALASLHVSGVSTIYTSRYLPILRTKSASQPASQMARHSRAS